VAADEPESNPGLEGIIKFNIHKKSRPIPGLVGEYSKRLVSNNIASRIYSQVGILIIGKIPKTICAP